VKAVTRHHGPSERFTANLADLDESTLNTVPARAGTPQPYYMDQWKAWYEGSTFPLPFTQQAVEASGTHGWCWNRGNKSGCGIRKNRWPSHR